MSETCILTAAQMRWADQLTIQSGTSGFELMDRAGRAVASAVLGQMPDYGRVVIVTGSGNNGGDGFAAAHYLKQHRIPVTIVSLVAMAELSGDSKAHADRARQSGAKIRDACSDECISELSRWLLRAVIVVDAIFGTGLNKPLQGQMADVVKRINQADRPVLSIDIASGICSDTGAVLGAAINADSTLPVAATKWGHWLNAGRDYTGELLAVADIGIDDSAVQAAWHEACECDDENNCFCVRSTRLIDDSFLTSAWPMRSRLSHKGSYGHVWIFGGSPGLTGAPKLAGLGAYAAGAGLASIGCSDDVWPVIAAANLEVMAQSQSVDGWKKADAIIAGPGWGKDKSELLCSLLASDKPLLLDADALNMVADDTAIQDQLRQRQQHTDAITVITPHPGEAARLLGKTVDEIQSDRKQSVLALTDCYACWVVLKGSETLIASPDKDIYLNPFGSPQLAVAGSGDVLAGMIGAQLARANAGIDPGILISSAVALHGKAGERSGWYLAGELAKVAADVRQLIEQDGKIH